MVTYLKISKHEMEMNHNDNILSNVYVLFNMGLYFATHWAYCSQHASQTKAKNKTIPF